MTLVASGNLRAKNSINKAACLTDSLFGTCLITNSSTLEQPLQRLKQWDIIAAVGHFFGVSICGLTKLYTQNTFNWFLINHTRRLKTLGTSAMIVLSPAPTLGVECSTAAHYGLVYVYITNITI